MPKTRFFALAALVLFTLTACNTVSGLGKDVKKVGEVVTREADEAKD